MTDPIHDEKSLLRTEMRSRLSAMTPEDRHEASVAVCQRLVALDAFQQASVVMLYMPLSSEVDLTPAAIRCFQAGKTVCVPQVNWSRQDMKAVEVTSFDDDVMDTDQHGLRTPRDCRPVVTSMINLIVVPGLAFDTSGHRLGRGGGYYDRFLPRLRRSTTKVGLAFDFQVVDHVPTDELDRRIDVLVTDRRTSERSGAGTRG